MNTAKKGRRNEHRSRDLLRADGYEVVRAAGSIGPFDLVGISAAGGVLVQVKSNRPPSQAEIEEMQEFPTPANFSRLVHVWDDHKRQPRIMNLGRWRCRYVT